LPSKQTKWIRHKLNKLMKSSPKTTGATSAAGTAYPFGAHEFTPGF